MRDEGVERHRQWIRQRAQALETRLVGLRTRLIKEENEQSKNVEITKKAIQELEQKIKEFEHEASTMKGGDVTPLLTMADEAFYVCDVCKKRILCPEQPRFHCTECSNFDLCQDCHSKNEHTSEKHPMVLETLSPDTLNTLVAGHPTVKEMLEEAFKLFAKRPCLGFRPKLPDGSFAKDYTWKTYEEIGNRVANLSSGFIGKLGLKKGSFVSICGRNAIEWFVSDFACACSSLITAPLHHSVDIDMAMKIMALSDVELVVCHKEKVQMFNEIRSSGKCPKLIHIVQMEDKDETSLSPLSAGVFTLKELEEFGSRNRLKLERPEDDDLFTVVFTSGSTGVPKGVPITQRLAAQNFTLYVSKADPLVSISKDSLSHISDREDVYTIVICGGRVGMISKIENVFEDIKILGPSVVSATPRFYTVLFSEFQAIWQDSKAKLIAKNPNCTPQELDIEREKALETIRGYLGKRVQNVLLGGAAINPEVKAFMRECWGAEKVFEGYGTSEVGNIAGDDGQIKAKVQWKLVDCPEIGYLQTDLPFPRGELAVKTPLMINSYFRNTGETNAAFDGEFFRTGDIVELIGENKIRIVDRKKFLFKLSQGEFVSPAKIEECLAKSPLVVGVFVTCADLVKYVQNSPLAVIVPNEARLRNALQIPVSVAFSELCSQINASTFMLKALRALGLASSLRPFEIPSAIILDSSLWTTENGLLTPSFKINRPALERKYRPKIEELAASLQSPSATSTTDLSSTSISREFATMREVLGLPEGTIEGNLAEAFVKSGGDSMSAIRLSSILKERHNITVTPEMLFEQQQSPSSLKPSTTKSNTTTSNNNNNNTNGDKMNLFDKILADSKMEPLGSALVDNLPSPGVDGISPENVFITGTTGFIGIHILAHAIMHTLSATQLYCLVRCKNTTEGSERLLEAFNLHKLNVDKEDFNRKVKVIPGDLSQPNLGITSEDRKLVITNCRTYINCGALVNHVKPYFLLRAPNVLGTAEVIKLASEAHASLLCHISTASTVSNQGQLLAIGQLLDAGGYTQSKWVSEKIAVSHAESLKVPLVIIRPGMVTWSCTTGVANCTDWLVRLIRGSISLGCAPRSSSRIYPTPVDFVAHVIWSVSIDPNGTYKRCSLNVVNSLQSVTFDLLTKMLSKIAKEELTKETTLNNKGREILEGLAKLERNASFPVWHECVVQATNKLSSNNNDDLLSGLLLFSNGVPDEGDGPRQVFFPTFSKYPLIDIEYATKFVKFLITL